jgi:hypothetical protein
LLDTVQVALLDRVQGAFLVLAREVGKTRPCAMYPVPY